MTTDLQARQRDRFLEQIDALAEALSIAAEWARSAEVNAPDEQLARAARLNAMVRQALIEATRLGTEDTTLEIEQ